MCSLHNVPTIPGVLQAARRFAATKLIHQERPHHYVVNFSVKRTKGYFEAWISAKCNKLCVCCFPGEKSPSRLSDSASQHWRQEICVAHLTLLLISIKGKTLSPLPDWHSGCKKSLTALCIERLIVHNFAQTAHTKDGWIRPEALQISAFLLNRDHAFLVFGLHTFSTRCSCSQPSNGDQGPQRIPKQIYCQPTSMPVCWGKKIFWNEKKSSFLYEKNRHFGINLHHISIAQLAKLAWHQVHSNPFLCEQGMRQFSVRFSLQRSPSLIPSDFFG